MAGLKDILQETMQGYAGRAFNGYSYLTFTKDADLFSVISVGQVKDKRIVNMGLVVRLQDDLIIIEHDINDKSLVDALVQAGVPRAKIILAYAGETLETA